MKHARRPFVVAAIATAIVMTAASPSAIADEHDGGPGGPSTPGVTVFAQDPGTRGDLRITLTGRTDAAGEPSASLVLRVEGVRVVDYDVHRIAVGDTACGGHEEGGITTAEHEGVRAVVRGVGVLGAAALGLPAGSAVQVWIDLKDRGAELYGDEARVRIRPAPHGGEEITPPSALEEDESCSGSGNGWSFDSSWQAIQQVRTHVLPGAAP